MRTTFSAGEPISARDLTEIAREVLRLTGFTVSPPLQMISTGAGIHISLPSMATVGSHATADGDIPGRGSNGPGKGSCKLQSINASEAWEEGDTVDVYNGYSSEITDGTWIVVFRDDEGRYCVLGDDCV